jgi:hypothetical protein
MRKGQTVTPEQLSEIRELASLPSNGSVYFEHVPPLLARIAQLERELAEARELLQEAWDYYGVLWRGNRIYNHVKTDAASKPAAPTADEKGE